MAKGYKMKVSGSGGKKKTDPRRIKNPKNAKERAYNAALDKQVASMRKKNVGRYAGGANAGAGAGATRISTTKTRAKRKK